MRGDLTIRTVRTASGATAVQVVQNKGKQRSSLKHIGSAHSEHELELLMAEARQYAEAHCRQPNLFAETPPPPPPSSFQDAFARSKLVGVTHQFARKVLLAHMLVCFMGLMMGKYLEINTKRSLRQIRKELLQVHEAHIRNEQTGEVLVMQMDTGDFAGSVLSSLLNSELSH